MKRWILALVIPWCHVAYGPPPDRYRLDEILTSESAVYEALRAGRPSQAAMVELVERARDTALRRRGYGQDFDPYDTIAMQSTFEGESTRSTARVYYAKTSRDRERMLAEIKDGKIYLNGNLVDTSEMPSKQMLYVMDARGNFYLLEGRAGYNHSSPLAGGEVAAAGMITVEKGVIKRVSNGSGHYLPSAHYLAQAVAGLVHLGASLDSLELGIIEGKKLYETSLPSAYLQRVQCQGVPFSLAF